MFVTAVANRPFGRLGVRKKILLCTAVCVLTVVVSRPFGRLGVERKILLCTSNLPPTG